MRIAMVMVRAALAALALATSAHAAPDGFPNQPVRLQVGYAPGGSVDIVARSWGRRLQDLIGGTVVVENRAGVNGALAAQYVAHAPPNGYTLYFAASPTLTIMPAIQKIGLDPGKDLKSIGVVANYANTLLVATESPYKTVADLVAAAKAKPGQLSYGSAGAGASNHLAGVMLSERAGVELLHVPFKGNAPALAEIMGGRVTMMFDLSSTAIASVRGGRMRALAVTGRERIAALPEVPTMIESGFKDFEFSGWLGVFAPAGLPPAVLERLVEANQRIVADPEFQAEMKASGYDMHITAEPLTDRMLREQRGFEALAQRIHLKVD